MYALYNVAYLYVVEVCSVWVCIPFHVYTERRGSVATLTLHVLQCVMSDIPYRTEEPVVEIGEYLIASWVQMLLVIQMREFHVISAAVSHPLNWVNVLCIICASCPFVFANLRRLARVFYPNHIGNRALYSKWGTHPMSWAVREARWNLLGHVVAPAFATGPWLVTNRGAWEDLTHYIYKLYHWL